MNNLYQHLLQFGIAGNTSELDDKVQEICECFFHVKEVLFYISKKDSPIEFYASLLDEVATLS